MAKKKSWAFNPMQIKDGWIVRIAKDGRIKQKIEPYVPKKPKVSTRYNGTSNGGVLDANFQ
jgi:hypothetical protein